MAKVGDPLVNNARDVGPGYGVTTRRRWTLHTGPKAGVRQRTLPLRLDRALASASDERPAGQE
jgi:hypothetical protein